ncbi:probable glycosyltransferase [Tanacetum coccineum]
MPILHSFKENNLECEDEDKVEIKMMGTGMDKESLEHNLYENDITPIVYHNFSPTSNTPIKPKDSGSFRMKKDRRFTSTKTGKTDISPARSLCLGVLCIRGMVHEEYDLTVRGNWKRHIIPEILVHSSENPLRELGGNPPSQPSVLSFFAGRMHENLRPILLKHWENKDPDMKIFGKLQKNSTGYTEYMTSSKYRICAKGYEVNSPRVVEAIFHECVPVIISDNHVPPFFEIFKCESFAVSVQEKDIPN